MRLKVLLPTEVLLDKEVAKVIAEGENGYFCLLPRHIDFLSVLTTGILTLTTPEGQEEFIALDGGILVKVGREVLVSSKRGVRGTELGKLQQTVVAEFQERTEREKKALSAGARLEADIVRRFMELRRI
ncbi:MAG: F0F1 ATP synthase subunit epsilon [Deltaproteobacteria bacterium]|nr:F0F1 ATP synthase subunit epsilon [Deltaproteobacteria bacterium]